LPQQNVEIVRRALAVFQETQRLLSAAYAPDWVWNMGTLKGWLGRPEFTGTEEFDAFLVDWIAPYDEWAFEPERIEAAGKHRVVAVLRQQGRLRDSRSWVDLRYGAVWTMKNGLIQRVDCYASPEEAFEAAGLSE
jgi:ketosteroid isomerase-like protein